MNVVVAKSLLQSPMIPNRSESEDHEDFVLCSCDETCHEGFSLMLESEAAVLAI